MTIFDKRCLHTPETGNIIANGVISGADPRAVLCKESIMPYLYETHLHTAQSSKCGRSLGSEHARYYKERGYQGIIITDHFFQGNTNVSAELPWHERVNLFCAGYEDALEEGQKIGLDVFFGWEQRFDWDEYLIYGLDKQWLLDHPEVETWNRREQLECVRRDGGCVVQAHPFRDRAYMTSIALGGLFADGIEGINASQPAYNNASALRYAKEMDLPVIAGSDNHNSADPKWTKELLTGIELDQKLKSIHELVRIIREKQPIALHCTEAHSLILPEDKPQLEVFCLNENEEYIPETRDWLRG